MTTRRVQAGESIAALSASTWNTFCEMADEWFSRRGAILVNRVTAARPSGIVKVRNVSGGDLAQYAVIQLVGTPFEPSTLTSGTAEEIATREQGVLTFLQQVVLDADEPDGDDVTKFAVLLQPLRDDAIGLAVVSGVTQVRVSMQSEEHEFARVLDGETGYMESAASGPARLLYVQPDSERDPGDADNLAWCVAMLGGGGSTGYFPVKVKKDGGAAGDAADPCSWTYSVYTIDAPTLTSDYLLDTALTPKMARTAIGPYQYAPDGSEGLCRYQDGDIVLCVAWGEVPEVAECAT